LAKAKAKKQTEGKPLKRGFPCFMRLAIASYLSKVQSPRDKPGIERFKQTLEYEWLYDSNLSLDPEELNPRLTE